MPNAESLISVWGLPNSGKTTYLAALYQQQKKATECILRPDSSQAHEFARTVCLSFESGIFPQQTDSAERSYEFKMNIITPMPLQPDRIVGTLYLADVSGEHVLDVQDRKGYFEGVLDVCTGILLMIDPENIVRCKEALSILAEKLAHDKISQALAFCITKCDIDKHWKRIHDDRTPSESYLRELLTPAFYDHFLLSCTRRKVKAFCISGVGRCTTPDGHSRPNIVREGGQYRLADQAQWAPYRVDDPLKWLLQFKKNNG